MRHSLRMPIGRELLTIMYHGRIFFECKSATLKPRGHAELGRVANVINLFPDMAIHVEVRLDASGFQGNSQDLQEARVRAVKDALLEQGVDPSGVQTTIHRASQTLSAEDTISVKVIDRCMAPYGQTLTGYHIGGQSYRQAC